MLTLNLQGLEDRESWGRAGIRPPEFDCGEMRRHTRENPVWLHFGAGNIFRGFVANLQHRLLEAGRVSSGITAAETFDSEIIDRIYRPHDDLALLVSLKPDGTSDNRIVAGIGDSIKGDFAAGKETARLQEVFCSPGLQLVSFTITEKGYALRDMQGTLLPSARKDLEQGPDCPAHAMGITAAMLYRRYQNGACPLALVSMDNCSRNGEKLRAAVLEMAAAWLERGFVEQGFLDYVQDEGRVSFPWSMIDKITPRPSETVREMLARAGVAGMDGIVTAKNTHIAPFVNAEAPEYLVVEDRFPNGRPPLEEAGVYLADRETVNNAERMKVTTCLNPLHTALAVYGCLLGYTSIAAEMADPLLKALAERIGYTEGMPVVIHPGIFSPEQFLREVIEVRLPNPFIPDTPQRIACDTSQKMAIRFGETIKAYRNSPVLRAGDLVGIPLVIAGWLRYLLGEDEEGNPMEPSSDPMLPELTSELARMKNGEPAGGVLRPLLSNASLFGTDLWAAGLGETITGMFEELTAGPGAVRRTLERYLTPEPRR